jgi:outer membrane protein OmpA-like peptidoglycan-associated protein
MTITRMPKAALFATQIGLLALLLASCASRPESLDQASTAVQQALADPELQKYAPAEIERARMAMADANKAAENGADVDELNSKAYVVEQNVAAARATAAERKSIEQAQAISGERDKVRLEGAQTDAAMAQERAARAEQELAALRAKPTDRGMVVTLGDVLFDTASATLKPGGVQQVQRLATFMQDNPDRNVMVEGYTDSRGSESYNAALSDRRASSVANTLIGAGIAPERITTRGMGESLPVATNETQAGRQQNRRVEVVIQNPPR